MASNATVQLESGQLIYKDGGSSGFEWHGKHALKRAENPLSIAEAGHHPGLMLQRRLGGRLGGTGTQEFGRGLGASTDVQLFVNVQQMRAHRAHADA